MQPARARPGDRACPLSVEALVRAASLLLDEQIGVVWVEGEVSSLRTPSSGHVYFVLKDARAQLPAVMWRSTAQRLRLQLEDGQRFVVRGKLSIYPEQGKAQLYVDALEPVGLGAQALRLEQLKQKLAAEGFFDPAKKRPLPRLPRRIGVVTSSTGAALRDILRVIERRFPRPILLSPCKVQGEFAAAEIAWAIRRITRARPDVDVVIVGRGGGSSEDLSAFNEEPVVRAIAACPVPVISAVGHETDVTLADLAADVRAATPTAAGEIAVPVRADLAEALRILEVRLQRGAAHAIMRQKARLEKIDKRLVALHPRARLESDRKRLAALTSRLAPLVERALAARTKRLGALSARLDAMSPLRVLERGYAIARTPDGTVITDPAAVAPGDPLALRVAGGEIDVEVKGGRPR